MRTAVVIDPRYQAHDTGAGHPERPERIGAVLGLLESYRRPGLLRLEPRPATLDEVRANHVPAHVERVEATAERRWYAFDADTPTGPRSFETALLAAGGVLRGVDAVMAGEADNAFVLARPPGHHAEPDRAMGFCLFNNVAVAAHALRRRWGVGRVLIVDWDVHHGNGTQRSFWDDPAVLFVSTHQYPFYPGTGDVTEVGGGPGRGFTVNVPLSAGCGDPEYISIFRDLVDPICRQFAPEFVLISAGFDAHRRDPLAGMAMTEAGFAALARLVLCVAAATAGGRVVAALEGGYDLEGLTRSVAAVLDEMEGLKLGQPLPDARAEPPVLGRARDLLRDHWDL